MKAQVQIKKSAQSRRHPKCYCAFCRSERRHPPAAHISFHSIMAALVASVLLMLAIWHNFDARVMFFFVMFICLAECCLQFRWRLSLACRYCGFDPILYLRKPSEASERVKRHLETRQKNPLTMFSHRPQLHLPIRRTRPGQLQVTTAMPAPRPTASILSKTV